MKKATKCMYLVAFVFVDGGLAGIEIISECFDRTTFQRFDLKKYQHKYQQNFALPHIKAFARDFNSANLP